MKTKLSILDYGLGNIFSVAQAASRIGFEVTVSEKPAELGRSDALILPGVGAFGDAIGRLKEKELDLVINDFISSNRPLLGICLGMQLMFDKSSEFGCHTGLRLLSGEIVHFPRNVEGGKVPQIQWNKVQFDGQSRLFSGMESGCFMYFLHSFYALPADNGYFQARSEYAGIEYCCALEKGNVFAVQFHPERSGEVGLSLLENYYKIARGEK